MMTSNVVKNSMHSKTLCSTLLIFLSLVNLVGCQSTEFYQKQLAANSKDPGPDHSSDPTTDTVPGNQAGDDGTTSIVDPPVGEPTETPTAVPTIAPTTAPGGVNHLSAQDLFQQNVGTFAKVDILFVVDNSGSMGDEQQNLANNFSEFLTPFLAQGVDFKMGITTTDPRNTMAGVAVAGSLNALTYANAVANQNAFISNFMNMVKVGIHGSGNEQGLNGADHFLQNYASTWLREDARLAIILISDEEDQSPLDVNTYISHFMSAKGNDASLLSVHSIADIDNSQINVPNITHGAARYITAADATSGMKLDIQSDFGDTLLDLSERIVNLSQSFVLTHSAIENTIHVFVAGVEKDASHWNYDSAQHAIIFNSGYVPPEAAEIRITYQYQ